MKIWLDDLRPAPEGWTWIRDPQAFLTCLHEETVTEISFDHDLGHFDAGGVEITGYTCLCWVEKRVRYDPDFVLPVMHVHSANPVGRERMQKVINRLKELQ